MEGVKTFFLMKVLLPEFINQSGVSVRDRGGSCFAPMNLALE